MKLEQIAAETPIFAAFTRRLTEAGLPTEDLLAEPAHYYALGRNSDDANAFGGLLVLGEEAILRSVVVPANRRGGGYGQAIVEQLSDLAARKGVKRLWLLTTNADGFFSRHGWMKAERADAPRVIAAAQQFSSTCPASAVLMSHSLKAAIDLPRRLVAEALGTALLLAIVIGSGIMGERLAGGNLAIALLGNTLATAAGLVVLIAMFGPISGAHFNPVVTLVMALRKAIGWRSAALYCVVQLIGAVLGVWLAHAMFGEAIFEVSTKLRSEPGQMLAEVVATFGLIGVILSLERHNRQAIAWGVGLFIASAYWFTSSTSFANPVVTLARSLSDTFAGIAPSSVPGFLAAQLVGVTISAAVFGWLLRARAVSS